MRKKLLITVLGLSVLVLIAGCGKEITTDNPVESNVDANSLEANEDTDKLELAETSENLDIETTLDVVKEYKSIDDLAKDSNIIIEGEIQDAKITYDTFGIYTNTEIKITNSIYGTLVPNDVISISFMGGTIEGEDAKKYNMAIIKEKFGTIDNNVSSEKIEQKVNGLDNFKTGDKLILFLTYENNRYLVTGAYQGRFKLTNDDVQLNKEFKDAYKELKKDKFVQEIKKSVSRKK